jgi:hypothetical protein
MKVWRVQTTENRGGAAGVVARAYGFTDSPDTEALIRGFNGGKEYGAVGIGRHGNVLQWGYAGFPSKMTEPARQLFINCIHYIAQFDGQLPLVRTQSSHRDNALRLAALITRIKDESFFSSTFGPELQTRFKGDPDGLVQHYLTDYELIYRDRTYKIDTDLKDLGIASNRQIETLERLIALLEDGEKGPLAKTLLDRYTQERFSTPAQWRTWFGSNRDRLFFSDVGGYKFYVIPKGYKLSAVQP